MILRDGDSHRSGIPIALVSSCPVHNVRLLDRCRCGRALSWRRPSLDLCECGRQLTRSDQNFEPANPRELAVSNQVAYLLGPAHFRLAARHVMHSIFDGITTDTYLRLVWAFGVIADDRSKDYPMCSNRVLRTEDATLIACRAFDQLHTIVTKLPRRKHLRVCHAALHAIRDDCVSGLSNRSG
ncbi:hypothetical protein R69746_07013 [Paraburkholderia aspalathi]|nr:hypothetical protein R69746_07013 [Paraburkholderia aspalathi]